LATVEGNFNLYKASIEHVECKFGSAFRLRPMHLWVFFLSGAAALSPFTGNDSLQTTIQLPPIQFDFPAGSGGDVNRASAVKSVIERTWTLYAEEAFGSDQIQPVNGIGINTRYLRLIILRWLISRNGWGAMIVDGLDTLLIANLTDDFLNAVNHTLAVDFTRSEGLVYPFETIIRYIGGLVATADLIKFLPGVPQGSESGLISQASTLANKLGPGYLYPLGISLFQS
jgi:mannosyl-oligosaccharide alpha-1,2-mannosidase